MKKNYNHSRNLIVSLFCFALACGIFTGLGLSGLTVFWLPAFMFGLAFISMLVRLQKNG